jgi:lipopolysaccharide/colanic/teichoic acid biosynthesis glycosyltransferase
MKIGGQRIPGKTLILVLSEGALIGCALLFATALRFRDLVALRQQLSEASTLARYLVVIIACDLALYYCDLYDLSVVRRRAVLFARLLQALGAACLMLAVVYYVDPDLSLGRGVAAIAAPIIISFVIGWRLLVDAGLPFLRTPQRILIVGSGRVGRSLAMEVAERPELNAEIIGVLEEEDAPKVMYASAAAAGGGYRPRPEVAEYAFRREEENATVRKHNVLQLSYAAVSDSGAGAALATPVEAAMEPPEIAFPVLGTVRDVERVAVEQKADLVVLSLAERRAHTPLKELLNLKFRGVQVRQAHDIYELVAGRILLDELAPSWLILSEGFRKSQWLLAAKRISDILLSLVALVLMAPVAALVALAVFVESGFPVMFRQQRVGLKGRVFQILKFRSMWHNGKPAKQAWTADSDPRITRVGRFIRKFRLDEIPQLVNVLLGDMSLVGPRPEQPVLAHMLEEEIPYYRQRHTLRPGITGWAQVKCGYGANVQESRIKLEYDLFYIKHLSAMLDWVILFETGKVMLSGKGAK